ncbi:alpha-(1,3)-fucosyltransferase C [Scaptodrosophila lebanonensis]|uniref:Fucosyltransferase n=1 Tax=Drosophila lebanonensis TaxID=7225 RepID=A0A6J2U1Q3_DROLE|nr:alpha-(1,3)-fucosyltransferase C [Scaptodrosophila lebanonensis]
MAFETIEEKLSNRKQTMCYLVDNKTNVLELENHKTKIQRARLNQRPLVGALLLLLCFGVFLCLRCLSNTPLVNQYGILRATIAESKIEDSNIRSILLWTSFFGDERWKLSKDTLEPEQFRDLLHCPIHQCLISNRRDLLPSIEDYDAIVFHVAEPFSLLHSVPARRKAHQAYVFALMEPPGETKHRLSDERFFYNLTMTYRLDSDIVWPYSELVEMDTGTLVAPTAEPHWRTPPANWHDAAAWRLWLGKTKMAAWFVSHCDTLSQREGLVAALQQQQIAVDIFGKCGPLSCELGDAHCGDMLDTDYKFYFAFENSLCTDYVTEKLYRALQHYVIPVVFGGANYTRFLPPYSYIDAENFKSVDDLARHLQLVANDGREYVRYFWWRRYYQLTYISPFCALCAHLHSPGARYRTQFYDNIEAWWLNSCRFHTNIRF